MAQLDIRTLFFSTLILNSLLSLFLLVLWGAHRKQFKGAGFWVLSIITLTTGNFLLTLRGSVHDFITIVIANTLLSGSFSFLSIGLIKFFKLKRKKLLYITCGITLFLFLSLIYFSMFRQNLVIRILLVSGAFLINILLCVYILIKNNENNKLPQNIITVFMCIVGFFMFLRIPLTIVFPPTNEDFLNSGTIQVMSILVWMVCISGWTIGLILMTSWELLEDERRVSKNKDILMRETHHRVKNNLSIITSLLSLQINQISDKKAKAAIVESQNRISVIELIHNMLNSQNDPQDIKVNKYLSILASSIFDSYKVPNAKLVLNIKVETLCINKTIICGLIVNELISNSCKYAFTNGTSGIIKLIFNKKENGNLLLKVEDNGVGLPIDFDIDKSESLGLKIVKSLSQQLEGTLEIEQTNGVSFSISFIS